MSEEKKDYLDRVKEHRDYMAGTRVPGGPTPPTGAEIMPTVDFEDQPDRIKAIPDPHAPRSAVDLAMERTEYANEPGPRHSPEGTYAGLKLPSLSDGVISVDHPRPGGDHAGVALVDPHATESRLRNEARIRRGDVRPGDVLPPGMMGMPEGAVVGAHGTVSVPDTRNTREVAIGQNPFVQKKEALVKEMVSSKYSMRRRGRMIPERGRMVVARVEWDEKLGSIFILDNHVKQLTESNQEVVILACGPLRIDPVTGKEVPMRFSIEDVIGRHCVIREHSGIEFITYDENGKMMICYWIGQSEIWGWLEPYPGDEVNSEEIWKAIAYLGEGTAADAPPPATCEKFCAVCSLRRCDTVHELGKIPHLCSDCVPTDMVWAIPEGTQLCEMHETYFAVQPAHIGSDIPFDQVNCCDFMKVRIVSA